MNDLTITVIQSGLHWEDPIANRAMFEEKIWSIGTKTDVIVLPEMFTTGFSMNAPALAEVMNQSTFKWMNQMARQTNALVIGSFIARENGKFYNRLLCMEPGGIFKTYDKRHLFRMANEHDIYSAGESRISYEWRDWNICPLICYDLRFPSWSRNLWNPGEKKLSYDVLVYVANWPEARITAWDTLLRARAIENLCFAVGVNRVGVDGKGIPYAGHSAVLSPKGESMIPQTESEAIQTVTLSKSTLEEYRLNFPAYLDADHYSLT